jgi:PAS domain S-box-containing protein
MSVLRRFSLSVGRPLDDRVDVSGFELCYGPVCAFARRLCPPQRAEGGANGNHGGRMQSISESALWMAISLSSDGIITSVSSNTEHLTGYSAHELVGHPVTVILGDRVVFEFSQMLKSAMDWGSWHGEIVQRTRSGKQSWTPASLTPLMSRQNDCAGFLMVSDWKPVTTGRDSSQAIEDVAAYLRRTSHELNNPLAVLMGFTQLILLDAHCDGKMRADVERLYSETKRIIQIVEKLHAFAVSLQDRNSDAEQVRKTS